MPKKSCIKWACLLPGAILNQDHLKVTNSISCTPGFKMNFSFWFNFGHFTFFCLDKPSSAGIAASLPQSFSSMFWKCLKSILFVSDSTDMGWEHLWITKWHFTNVQLQLHLATYHQINTIASHVSFSCLLVWKACCISQHFHL